MDCSIKSNSICISSNNFLSWIMSKKINKQKIQNQLVRQYQYRFKSIEFKQKLQTPLFKTFEIMSIIKSQKGQLGTARAQSCANLQQKSSEYPHAISKRQRQQKLIESLLLRNTPSTKNIFTDETTYTYKPQISHLPVQLYPQIHSQIQVSKQTIFERLVDNMKSKQQKFKLLKLRKQDEEFKQTCRFVPQISETSKIIMIDKLKTQGPQQSKQPFTRLYKQGLEKIINTQKEYMTAQERQLTDEYTFQPEINPTSRQILNNQSRNIDPIFKRFQIIMDRKKEEKKLIQEEKTKLIEEMGIFKVNNKKTLQLLEKNQNYQVEKGNVVKRLLQNYFKTKEEKMSAFVQEQQEKLKRECTFQPKINGNYLLMNASTFDLDQNFLERQKYFEQSVKQNIEMKANEWAPTFRPEINKLSQLICKQREYQSLEDKLNRLNHQPLFDKEAQLEELERSLYKECKFHPEINEISKALQGPLKPHACKCHPTPQQFNFQPKINQKSKQILKNNTKPVVQLQNKKKREEILSKIKMERQYNELVECTFQPKIRNLNKERLKLNSNTADFVSGVKEFVQKRNLAMRKREQDEKYMQKIFNLQKRYKSKTFTTVQEFKLSHKIYEGKGKKQLIEKAEQNFKKNHPFKPNVELIR